MKFDIELKKKLEEHQKKNPPQENIGNYKHSAVLVLLYLKDFSLTSSPLSDLEILLIKRSKKLKNHRGQFAFPGGVQEKKDLNLIFTAQRETFEEVGIISENYYILGSWIPLDVSTGYRIFPFIGLTNYQSPLTIDKNEVDSAFWINIKEFLFNEQLYSRPVSVNGNHRLAWHYPTQYGEIWGATGTILHDFLFFLTEQFAKV